MSLTTKQQQWHAQPGKKICLLVEANYLLAGELQTLYISNYGFRSLPSDSKPNQPYRPWLNAKALISFSQRMAEALYGQSEIGVSAIEFFLHPDIEPLINQADFAHQAIKLLIGDPTWALDEFIPWITAKSDNLSPVDNNRVRLKFTDRAQVLVTPVLTNTYTTGDSQGQFKPRCFGQCFNVEPVLINSVTNTYQFNDGQLEEVTNVRENGYPVTTYDADLAAGTITFTTRPTGRITADVKGHVENGVYLDTAELIINYLLSLAGESVSVDSGVLPGYLLGRYVRDQLDITDLIDEIAVSVGAYWLYDAREQFRLLRYAGVGVSTGQVTPGQIKANGLTIKNRFAAVKNYSLGYARNWTEQTEGLAAALTPEQALAYSQKEQKVTGTNTLINPSAGVEVELSTLLVNKADAEAELNRRLALRANPRTLYQLSTTQKHIELGVTKTLTYPRYLSTGQDGIIVGHVAQLNSPFDVIEVLL
ncbi:hypothetical protein SG34_010600 [Thalassomonas viridans]|uniref:Uncharacterized protein n=1 Tax=Thalassomonas viridans TaxID=137584 RepID=A0AAE9Z782_9GAMM|nr:hypothetical protein [Thalassomonas viridans]WDE07295.1 hypothetical protein SG34_010600 [Thalassomonas viridans]